MSPDKGISQHLEHFTPKEGLSKMATGMMEEVKDGDLDRSVTLETHLIEDDPFLKSVNNKNNPLSTLKSQELNQFMEESESSPLRQKATTNYPRILCDDTDGEGEMAESESERMED